VWTLCETVTQKIIVKECDKSLDDDPWLDHQSAASSSNEGVELDTQERNLK